MRLSLLPILTALALSALAAPPAKAPAFTRTPSKYRVVSPTAGLDARLQPAVAQGVGVGNVIFGLGELPFQQENAYRVVKSVKLSEIQNQTLELRYYCPGTMAEIIRHIEASTPGFRFKDKYTRLQVFHPSQGASHLEFLEIPSSMDAEAMRSDQGRWTLTPTCDFKRNFRPWDMVGALKASPKSGEFRVRVTVWLRFETPKGKLVTTIQPDGFVTQKVHDVADILVSAGELTVVK